ncbi:hypothetical protein [Chryseobacterium sp. WLY505]|nr:hypothetical protein [Chryseobacterium sp. WLY505]MDQ1856299.1 hypothetical protein [Chryseobacterium sp. WLY505]
MQFYAIAILTKEESYGKSGFFISLRYIQNDRVIINKIVGLM